MFRKVQFSSLQVKMASTRSKNNNIRSTQSLRGFPNVLMAIWREEREKERDRDRERERNRDRKTETKRQRE